MGIRGNSAKKNKIEQQEYFVDCSARCAAMTSWVERTSALASSPGGLAPGEANHRILPVVLHREKQIMESSRFLHREKQI
jgi:hypothetical protein